MKKKKLQWILKLVPLRKKNSWKIMSSIYMQKYIAQQVAKMTRRGSEKEIKQTEWTAKNKIFYE